MGKHKHGQAPRGGKSLTYRRWESMMRRCHNPGQQNFRLYGGRGVTVCAAWKAFEVFQGDMGECPKGMTLDRIDPKGNYEPGNCRWASTKVQGRNRLNNNRITFRGETRCLVEWAEYLGLQPKTLRARLYDHDWSVERAFTEPLRGAVTLSQTRHSASDSKMPDAS